MVFVSATCSEACGTGSEAIGSVMCSVDGLLAWWYFERSGGCLFLWFRFLWKVFHRLEVSITSSIYY